MLHRHDMLQHRDGGNLSNRQMPSHCRLWALVLSGSGLQAANKPPTDYTPEVCAVVPAPTAARRLPPDALLRSWVRMHPTQHFARTLKQNTCATLFGAGAANAEGEVGLPRVLNTMGYVWHINTIITRSHPIHPIS
jgi:hypothetical protein